MKIDETRELKALETEFVQITIGLLVAGVAVFLTYTGRIEKVGYAVAAIGLIAIWQGIRNIFRIAKGTIDPAIPKR